MPQVVEAFANGRARKPEARRLFQMMTTARHLAEDGVRAEVGAVVDRVTPVLLAALKGPMPMRLTMRDAQLLRELLALHEQQRGLVAPTDYAKAQARAQITIKRWVREAKAQRGAGGR